MCTQCVVHWVDTSLPPQNSISIRSAEFARLTGVSNTHRQAAISDHKPQTCQIGRNRPHLFCACDATEKTADSAGPNSPKRVNVGFSVRIASARSSRPALDRNRCRMFCSERHLWNRSRGFDAGAPTARRPTNANGGHLPPDI